ncbi:MAG: Mannosyl-glycoprotein endo-beta-N-acetylglucosaminidase [Firmicutes bacterium]|nr:Mannosyl-glycoprotein endo-beta-N-acetylglucosaminidase [Bacillota bacterium]
MTGARKYAVVFCLAILSSCAWTASCPVLAAENQEIAKASVQQESFYDRVMEILRQSVKQDTSDFKTETPIFGAPEVTKDQMVKYIIRHNPKPKLSVPIEELVEYYYQEAAIEGIRPDAAVAQAILETGFFYFGGDVLPDQNNFAGLGTIGQGVRGAYFDTARIGVRAHIQHLMAYATTHEPVLPIADPRYAIVKQMTSYFGQCQTWESLSGRWAVPGVNYGQRIIKIIDNVKNNR